MVVHRRGGKTVATINDLLKTALTCTKPNPRVAYVAPQFNQAKDVAWGYVHEFAGVIPGVQFNEAELRCDLPNGGRLRLYGADNYERLRGIYLDDVALDEYADMDPRAWSQVIRPALTDREGRATFIGTPKGANGFKDIWDEAGSDPEWFRLMLKASESGILAPAELISARRRMTEDEYEQEFECSFSAAVQGAFYAKDLTLADQQKRIGRVPHAPELPVHTAWDLGIDDATAIWFYQVAGQEIRVIGYYETSGQGLPDIVRDITDYGKERRFRWGDHYLPHDVEVRELGTGRSRKETLQQLGLDVYVVPNIGLVDGINSTRMIIARCWFDAEECKVGLNALRLYRRAFDEKRKVFIPRPLHDWCFTADTKVLTKYGTHPISMLPQRGEILTACGWRQYENPRVTRRNAPLVEVAFADGLTVKCTPEHLFLTDSGWKSAERLETGSVILSSLTLSRSISMVACTGFGLVKTIGRAVARNCTARFGQMLSALSPRDATSTMWTVAPATTASATWNAFPPRSTYKRHGLTIEGGESLASTSPKARAALPPIGTDQMRAVYGTSATPNVSNRGRNGSESQSLAQCVASSFRRLFVRAETRKSSAPRYARPRTITSVKVLSEQADVWCMTVPGEEAFSLSNGAIVHNCSHAADAFRMLGVAYRAPRGYYDEDNENESRRTANRVTGY